MDPVQSGVGNFDGRVPPRWCDTCTVMARATESTRPGSNGGILVEDLQPLGVATWREGTRDHGPDGHKSRSDDGQGAGGTPKMR